MDELSHTNGYQAAETSFEVDQLIRPPRNHGFNMSPGLKERSGVAGVKLIEPQQLYNILMQFGSHPCVSDPNYLLILGKAA